MGISDGQKAASSTNEAVDTRAGFVAIVGRPNVGKSTLLNALVGEKVAIVSNRPQTTRNRILGVRTFDKTQIVLVDTPGIHRNRANISQFMVREALQSVDGVDCVTLVVEVASKGRYYDDVAAQRVRLHPEDRYVLEQVQQVAQRTPMIVAINKIDTLKDRKWMLPLIESWRQAGMVQIVPISARKGTSLDRLIAEMGQMMPVGPHLYPEDMLTDRAERFLAAELVREQIFLQSRQEIPYSTAVEIERFEERPDLADVWIEGAIYVEREGQKAIIIGHQGNRIREIGIRSREAIGRLVNCPVHLKLTVRVATDWTRTPRGRRRFGYE